MEAQRAIARYFAESIDFSVIADSHKQILTKPLIVPRDAGLKWTEALSNSIDLSSITEVFNLSLQLEEFARNAAGFQQLLKEQMEPFARISEQLAALVPKIDLSHLGGALARFSKSLGRGIPSNLQEVRRLDVVAAISLEEGIPLSWIPRREIVVALLDAPDAETRFEILTSRQDDILDDCRDAVTSIDHEWAVQCRDAVDALRADFQGPAQSHASNIIDSIFRWPNGKDERQHAKEKEREPFDNVLVRLAAAYLTLKPRSVVFDKWFPSSGQPLPKHFNRHVTSHAVGHPGVFSPTFALVAVMFATSLTVQYATTVED